MTDAPILWPPDAQSWLTGKDLDAGKDWRQEKGTIEDKMVGWHHQLDRHEFEQTLGESEGQGMLACCSSWGHKESDMTEQLNNNRGVTWSWSHTDSPRGPGWSEAPFLGYILPSPTFSSYGQGQWGLWLEVVAAFQLRSDGYFEINSKMTSQKAFMLLIKQTCRKPHKPNSYIISCVYNNYLLKKLCWTRPK